MNEQIAIEQWLSKPAPRIVPCGCLGPRKGEPDCPCAMQWIEKVDGSWYRIHEHRSTNGITHSAERIEE
jgi:hypothetical protein